MRVGLFLSNQHRPGTDMVAALHEQIDLVRAIRDLGWDSVWTGHHFLSTQAKLQPIPLLGRLAAEAEGMSIGLGIHLLALLNPVQVAEEVASLDVIAQGRLVYGAGLGYREVEYDAFGVSKRDAVGRFVENLGIVERLLAGEEVSADLPWCRLDGVRLELRPVQSPRPPIWIGANQDVAVRRAAALGDAWLVNPHVTRSTAARQVGLFRKTRAELEKPPAAVVPALKEVFCAPSREEAYERCAPFLAAKYQEYVAWGQEGVLPGAESFRGGFHALREDRFIVGSPSDCREQLEAWRTATGLNYLIMRSHWSGMSPEHSLESINLMSSEVLPALHG